MATLRAITEVAAVLADLLTIVASAIAIGLFVLKRKDIGTAFSLLLAWAFQTTLSDLNAKLDRLNEYNAREPTDVPEIQNILHEVAGQVRGNVRLMRAAPKIADRVEELARSRKLSEPAKRAMVAEVREVVRNIQILSFDTLGNKSDE